MIDGPRDLQGKRPVSLLFLRALEQARDQVGLEPVVLGHGKPFFAGPRPRLRLAASDVIVGDVVRLTYVPA
jgi:hypothetical protein